MVVLVSFDRGAKLDPESLSNSPMVMEIREDRCSWDLNLGLTPETDLQLHYGFIDYAKAFDCVGHNKLRKILNEMGIPDHLTFLWETYMQVRKQQLELAMEQQTGSK